jgi:hypothetical protein
MDTARITGYRFEFYIDDLAFRETRPTLVRRKASHCPAESPLPGGKDVCAQPQICAACAASIAAYWPGFATRLRTRFPKRNREADHG